MQMKYILVVFFISVSFPMLSQHAEKYLKRGDAYYSIREYAKAVDDYERYIYKHSSDREVLLKLGDCYKRLGNLQEAEGVYSKYFSLEQSDDSIMIVYADVLKQLSEYEKARHCYQKLSERHPKENKFLAYSSLCDSMIEKKLLSEYSVENLKNINSENSDIAPVIFKKGIVFSSNREGTIIKRKTGNNNLPLYDLYWATGEDSIRPDLVCNFSLKLNTIHHECCATFTGDYKKIFFTRSLDKPYAASPGAKNPLKMYSAEMEGHDWGDLHTFIFNDTTRSYAHPSVEANEEMFFFASDMEGGYGGTDIYVCFNIDGKWTNPVNLGPEVNTEYNEMYPFYHFDGTLYFSSNRPESIGGYDIFYAIENENGEYGNVRNMGAPVNSPGNDISINLSKDKAYGYFSSEREGGKGHEDIYLLKK